MVDQTDASLLIIRYDPRSSASIEAGLTAYQHYLVGGQAFVHGRCQVKFEILPGSDDTIGILSRLPTGQILFDFCRLDEEQVRPNALLSDTGLVPETIFFLRACLFPELQQALYETAKVLCQVSRQINDATQMLVSDQEVCGLVPLFLISLCYPKYAYLLGGFIVPFWDRTRFPCGQELPSLLVGYLGYTDDTLKAFCYCDNPHIRAHMFSAASLRLYYRRTGKAADFQSQTPLLDIFRQQPQEFATFTKLLRQRFAEQPYLQDTDDPRYYLDNPVESILLTVLYPYQEQTGYLPEDQPEQTLDARLIDCPAREVAEALKNEIEQYVTHPINQSGKPEGYLAYYPDHYICGTAIRQWQTFIVGAFEHGNRIWAYVESGRYPDIPACVRACDIRQIAAQGHFALSQMLEYYIGPYDSLNSEIVPILQTLLYDWNDDAQGEDMLKQNQQKLLRLLDVIHRWNDLQSFPGELMYLIVEEQRSLSEPAFLNRYHGDWVHLFTSLVKDIGEYRGIIESGHFCRCYALICAYRGEAGGVIRRLAEGHSGLPLATVAALLAGIVCHDQHSHSEDELTQFACEWLNEHLSGLIMRQLADYSAFPVPQDIDKASSSVQQDYRYLQAYLTGAHHQQDDVVERMNHWLYRESRAYSVSDTQVYYQLLNDFEEDSQKFLVSALIMADCPASPIADWCSRWLGLWLKMAPGKVCRMIGYFWLKKSQPLAQKIAGTEMLAAMLMPHGLSPVAATAYLMESAIDSLEPDDDIEPVLAPFFDQYLKEQREGMPAQIESALKLMKPVREQIFYMALQDAYPDLKLCYFDQAVLALMSRCICQRMVDTAAEDESLPEQAHTDLEQFIRLMGLPVPISPRQIEGLLQLCDQYQLDDFETPYGQTVLGELIWYASPHLRINVLRLLVVRPSLGLERCYHETLISPVDFCQLLVDCDMRSIDLLTLILSAEWYECLPWFADTYDIHPLMETLSLRERLDILRVLAFKARQQDFVDGYPDELPGKIQ